MPAQTCDHRPLVRGPLGQIDYCPHCNVLNIFLGFVSLRLEPQACEALHDMLGRALNAVRKEDLALPASRPAGQLLS